MKYATSKGVLLEKFSMIASMVFDSHETKYPSSFYFDIKMQK